MNKIALCFALMLFSPLSIATASPYIPQNESECTRFSVYGAWLYFSPTSETTYYYVDAALTGNMYNVYGTRHANKMDNYYSGYRAGIGYLPSSCTYLTATWSDLKADHSDSITSMGVFPILGPSVLNVGISEFAAISTHFHYFALDTIFGMTFFDNTCFNLSLFGGIHYAKLISKDTFEYSTGIDAEGGFTDGAGKQISDFWGIGPQLGFNARLPIWQRLSLFGNACGSILVGRPNTSMSFTNTQGNIFNPPPTITPFNAINERVWRCVPQGDLQIGLNYDFYAPLTWCKINRMVTISLEIGYEMITYFDGLSDLKFTDSYSVGDSFEVYRNVTMHGLNVGLSVAF